MPVIVVNGIVTRYVNYRENDRILSLFTIEQGRIDAKARGCRKPTSALLACAQPFVYGEFELYQGRDKAIVNQCEIKESFFRLREDITRFAIGSVMLQLTQEAVQIAEPNAPLFSLLYHALSHLSYGETDPNDLLLLFLLRFLDRVGYRPSITVCAKCGRDVRSDGRLFFSARQGGTVCAACSASAKEVSVLALEAMRRMLLLPDEEMGRVRLTEPLRKEIGALLPEYTETALDYGARALGFLKQL